MSELKHLLEILRFDYFLFVGFGHKSTFLLVFLLLLLDFRVFFPELFLHLPVSLLDHFNFLTMCQRIVSTVVGRPIQLPVCAKSLLLFDDL